MADARFKHTALVIAALAGLHGLLYAPLLSTNVGTDSASYRAAGSALLAGSYSTPIKDGLYFTYPNGFYDLTALPVPRGPVWNAPERQAFRPPGYPVFLAATGEGRWDGALALQIVLQGIMFAGGAFLLALTVRRWWGPRVALIAAVVYALDPYSKHYVGLVMSETLAGALVLAGAYAFTRAWQRPSPGWWALAGAAATALTLTRAVFVVAIPLVVLGAAIRAGAPGARLRRVAAAALCSLVLLAPWLAWTNHVAGRPVLANWGEGFNFLVAANGEGHGRTFADVEEDPAFDAELRTVHRFAPSFGELRRDPQAHPRYLDRADRELRRAASARYRERLRDEPAQVVWEDVYRMYFLWAAHNDWYQPGGTALGAMIVLDWIVLLFALVGAALALARGGAAAGIVVFLAAYTLVLGTHHVEARFAIPVRGLFLALGVLAATELYGLARRRAAAGAKPASRKAHTQNGAAVGLPTDVR
ncbi:MAG: glycosyltransferase family 39 protein [Actinomycetota bacterium]|nr:glycosyltransferase family 39 protein [Actinomycetota bacterium]